MNSFVVSGQTTQKTAPKKAVPVKRPVKRTGGGSAGYGGMMGEYMPLILAGVVIYFIAKK
jgi:hypothetical protein